MEGECADGTFAHLLSLKWEMRSPSFFCAFFCAFFVHRGENVKKSSEVLNLEAKHDKIRQKNKCAIENEKNKFTRREMQWQKTNMNYCLMKKFF